MLRAENLSCIRQGKLLFENLSFTVSPGSLLLVEGENGSGKSSLLRLLTGLAMPESGEILWQENFGEEIHYLSHQNGLKLGLTVAENLQLAGHLFAMSANNFSDVLNSLQLNSYLHTQTKFLSAGLKRRVALAKLFIFPKKIWILDEPLTALDVATQAFFIAGLEKHLENGGVAIVSSHHAMTLSRDFQRIRL